MKIESTQNKFTEIDDIVFTITEKQLSELTEKLSNKIQKMLNNEGKSTKALALTNSVSDTIRTYFKKTY